VKKEINVTQILYYDVLTLPLGQEDWESARKLGAFDFAVVPGS
jgi:hypothetical protein